MEMGSYLWIILTQWNFCGHVEMLSCVNVIPIISGIIEFLGHNSFQLLQKDFWTRNNCEEKPFQIPRFFIGTFQQKFSISAANVNLLSVAVSSAVSVFVETSIVSLIEMSRGFIDDETRMTTDIANKFIISKLSDESE